MCILFVLILLKEFWLLQLYCYVKIFQGNRRPECMKEAIIYMYLLIDKVINYDIYTKSNVKVCQMSKVKLHNSNYENTFKILDKLIPIKQILWYLLDRLSY